MPVSLFILEHGLQKHDLLPIAVNLPGENVWLFADEKISIVEKGIAGESENSSYKFEAEEKLNLSKKPINYFSYSDKKNPGNHTKAFPLDFLFKRINFRLKSQRIFFSDGSTSKLTNSITQLSSALRIVTMFFISLATILSLVSLSLKIAQSNYDDLMQTYQNEYALKGRLEDDVEGLEKQIEQRGLADYQTSSYAGVISAFCQRRPSGLKLEEITIAGDKDGKSYLTADGIVERENSVFVYKDYIAEVTGDLSLEIISIKPIRPQRTLRNQQSDQFYNFKHKLELNGK
jgi:hypothetical protein